MEPSGPTAAESTLDQVCERLKTAAAAAHLQMTLAPELAGQIFQGSDGGEASHLPPEDLPHPVRGLKIGRYAVVIATLPDQASIEAVTEALRRFRNQCVVARSFLSANEALDLQGILVGPRGSETADDWTPLALLVERDDRVARKFAWLRPKLDTADDTSFSELTKRTFLARPWENESTFTVAALDNLNRAAAMWDTTVPRDTVDEWVKLSLGPRDDSDKLVQGLVETWARRGLT